MSVSDPIADLLTCIRNACKAKHKKGILFKTPHKIDPMNLVPVETIERDGVRMMRLPEHEWRQRAGLDP